MLFRLLVYRGLRIYICTLFTVYIWLLNTVAQTAAFDGLLPDQIIESAIQCQNLGLAYLEESQPQKAVEQFQKLVELLPKEAIGYGNLAVAQLRLKQADLAWQTIQQGLKIVPMESRLHIIAAEILQLRGQFKPATEEIEEAVRLNPDDLEARYQLVRQNMRQRNDSAAQQRAIADLQTLRQLTPTNIVVLMKLSQLLATEGEIELTQQIGQELQILLADIPADKLKFLTDGLTAVHNGQLKIANRNLRIFENINKNTPRYQQGIAELDTPILGHPIEDFDLGFRSRLVAELTPPIEIYFTAIRTHIEKPKTNSIQLDYDHDGDLDALELNANRMKMWRNDGDGTFSDATEKTFGNGFQISGTDATFADFDDDGDVDLITVNNENCFKFDNLRQGKLQPVPILTGQRALSAIDSGDYDNNGAVDLLLVSQQMARTYKNRGDGTFVVDRTIQFTDGTDCHFVDYDNDGFLDLWLISPSGHSIWRNDGQGEFSGQSRILPSLEAYGDSGLVSDFDRDGDLDLVHFLSDNDSQVLQNDGGNQNRWLQIELEAVVEGNNKNNLKGIGSRLEIKAGNLYQLKYVDQTISHFGLGKIDLVDVARIVWTNGVPQNVIQPQANQKIDEKQVLKGSCPFLYVYDGNTFTFVTDLLWKSPLGMITPIGTVASSKSADDYVLIGDRLKEKDGHYILKITEELWETAYFDQVKLITVDHPDGTQVLVDEKFTPVPSPPFEIHQVETSHFPISAVDHQGNDVLDRLKDIDYRYAIEHPPGLFQGVVEPHFIELDLARFDGDSKQLGISVGTPATVKLYLTGWVFPTDTSINVSISQNPAVTSTFPYLQVQDKRGKWQTVINPIGIPAGKNKTVVTDLTGKFLSASRKVRIMTDMQVYWDRAFFTVGKQEVPTVVTELRPQTATLQYLGFPKLYRPTPHGPHLYNYTQIDKKQRWRDMGGFYTRYGKATELLTERDDQLVVMNAGDEITVTFSADNLPDLPVGWQRSFILFSDGWVKDADINTLASQTVEPLPFHQMSDYPPPEDYPAELRAYNLEYNTRRVKHVLPPLEE